jgi:hypothetical protein
MNFIHKCPSVSFSGKKDALRALRIHMIVTGKKDVLINELREENGINAKGEW